MTGRPTAAAVLGAALGATALVAVRLGPVLADPTGTVWGAADADTLGLLWTLWHVAAHLADHGSLGLHSALAGFPEGGTVWPANPVEAVVAAPLTLGLGAAAAYNLLQLAHPGLTAGLTALLARRLGASTPGALGAGLTMGLSPVLLCSAHNGNVEMGQLYWLPLAGLAALGAARGGAGRLALAGLTVGLALIAHLYVGILAAGVAAALLLARADARPGARLAGVAAVALAVAGPPLGLAWTLTQAEDALAGKDLSIVARMRLLEGQTPLLRLLSPGPVVARDPQGTPGAYLNAASPGLVVGALGLWGLRSRGGRLGRWLGALALGGLLLALGPTLLLWEEPVVVAGRQVPLPFLLLDRIPPFPMMIELWRFTAALHLALALGAALAITRLPRRWGAAAAAALALEAALITPGAAVYETTALPGDDLHAAARALPGEGAVLSFPLSQRLWPLYAQTVHGQPISLGPDKVSDPDLLAAMRRPEATLESLRRAARAKGFRWLLVHPRHETGDPREDSPLLDALGPTGAVVARFGAAGVVDLEHPGPWPELPPEGPRTP